MTSIQAIKAFCCSGGCCESAQQAKQCPDTKCELYPFRLGHNPNRDGLGFVSSKNARTRNTFEIITEKKGKDTSTETKAAKQRVESPLKAIRAYCLGCCLGQPVEVAACPATECILHPFRMGRKIRSEK